MVTADLTCHLYKKLPLLVPTSESINFNSGRAQEFTARVSQSVKHSTAKRLTLLDNMYPPAHSISLTDLAVIPKCVVAKFGTPARQRNEATIQPTILVVVVFADDEG